MLPVVHHKAAVCVIDTKTERYHGNCGRIRKFCASSKPIWLGGIQVHCGERERVFYFVRLSRNSKPHRVCGSIDVNYVRAQE